MPGSILLQLRKTLLRLKGLRNEPQKVNKIGQQTRRYPRSPFSTIVDEFRTETSSHVCSLRLRYAGFSTLFYLMLLIRCRPPKRRHDSIDVLFLSSPNTYLVHHRSQGMEDGCAIKSFCVTSSFRKVLRRKRGRPLALVIFGWALRRPFTANRDSKLTFRENRKEGEERGKFQK